MLQNNTRTKHKTKITVKALRKRRDIHQLFPDGTKIRRYLARSVPVSNRDT